MDKSKILSYLGLKRQQGSALMSQAAGRKSARRAHTAVGHAFKAPTVPRHDSIAAGLRAFFEIKEKWQLSYEEARTLLGQPGKSTYYNWQRGQVGDVVHRLDLATRLSYVLGIFKALNEIYEHPELADSWVRKPNAAFGGQSALDRMLGGQVVDLARVREYLDSVRG
jgi:hypothetical protein